MKRQWQWLVVFAVLILSTLGNVYLTRQTAGLRHQVDTLQAERNTAAGLQRQVDALQIQVNVLRTDNQRLAELVRTLGGNPDPRPTAATRSMSVAPAPVTPRPEDTDRPSPGRRAAPRPTPTATRTARPSPSPSHSPTCLLGLVCR